MKRTSGCRKVGIGLFLAVGLVTVAAVLFFNYASYRQKQLRTQYMPPTVLVTDPTSEATAVTGSYFNVSATALGTRPIVRLELWLDGELLETKSSEQPQGRSPFYVNFAVLVPADGAHLIFVRAVTRDGIIGQSLPVSLSGEAPTANSSLVVPVRDGESLAAIANAGGTTPETLRALNPGLGNLPPPGTLVQLPPAPRKQPPAAPVPPKQNVEFVLPGMLPMLPEKSPGQGGGGNPIFDPLPGPPSAPTNLRAQYKDCKIELLWNDNSGNEDYYLINVAGGDNPNKVSVSAPRQVKASPGTGPAWTEFMHRRQGVFSITVQAVNSVGSQLSNPAQVYVPSTSECLNTDAAKAPKRLAITVLDMTAMKNFDKTYCYISLENVPEHRVPLTHNKFLAYDADGTLAKYEIPIPADGVLDTNGKCLGWIGNTLNSLGTFSGKLPQNTWTGEKQVLYSKGYQIIVRLTPLTDMDGPIESTDPTLSVPYDLRMEPVTSVFPIPKDASMLSWAWDGNLSSPHGFQIFRNGEPYFSYNVGGPPLKRYTQLVQWPSGCGAPVVWRVAAKVGSTLSDLSAPFRQDLPPCKMYLKVTFDYLQLDRTNEEFDETLDTTRDSGMPCDPLDIYYKLSVWHSHRYFYGYAIGIYQGTYHFVKLDCGTYSILGMADGYHKTLYGPEPHVIIIPLTAGQDVHAIPIQADFQDADGFSSDDLVAGILEYPLDAPHYANPNSKWSECSVSKTIDFAGKYASSHITYTYEYFPNKCMDLPPEMQK